MADAIRADRGEFLVDPTVGDTRLHSEQSFKSARNASGTAPADVSGSSCAPDRAPDLRLDIADALTWCGLLNREPWGADMLIRAIGPEGAIKGNLEQDCEKFAEWQARGFGIYAIPNAGGHSANDISLCNSLFNEWDDLPLEEQISRPAELGLPAPTMRVLTGGKSIHNYWTFTDPIATRHWRTLIQRLINLCKSDPSVKDPSRCMRLPGAFYAKDGIVGKRTSIIDVTSERYPAETFDLLLPPLPTPVSKPRQHCRTALGQVKIRQIADALNCIPRRVPGSGTYSDYVRILWGLIEAVEAAGWSKADAIEMMEEHSPSKECGWDIEHTARSPGEQVKAGTFFWYAQQHGWRHA